MKLVFAVVFLWLGASMLYLGSHSLQASSPWDAYRTVLTKIAGGDDDGGA